MENRRLVESLVEENPGISFTGLKEETGLANGVLQYHIRSSEHVMKKRGALLPEGACQGCRFSGICSDTCILRELRRPTRRRVLQGLQEGKKQREVAAELELDRSTVSYHVSKLRELGLIENGEPVDRLEL